MLTGVSGLQLVRVMPLDYNDVIRHSAKKRGNKTYHFG